IGADAARIEARASGTQRKVALWSADEGVKTGLVTALDGEVEADAFESHGEFLRIRAHDFKILQAATCGSILGGVDRIGAPFDEEREKAVAIVGEVDGFPGEDAAIRALSGAVLRARECDLIFAKKFCGGGDVGWMDGPADEAWLLHPEDLGEVKDRPLRRIRGDDFEIATFAQREERVARASAGMDSAECGADAGAFFDEVDAAVEIVAADDDVIEQCGHLVVSFRVCGACGPG